jgi:hypothetical protein
MTTATASPEYKIQAASVTNFKGIDALQIEANGNHVILRGVNGAGKTAAMEAILTALRGKKALPKDPVRVGAEESHIELDMADENGGKLKVVVDIAERGEKFELEVNTVLANGMLAPIKKPMTFLESIVGPVAFDPYSFLQLSDAAQVEAIIGMRPGLKEKLAANDAEFITLKAERSKILSRIEEMKVDQKRMLFYEDVPAEEVDPADLVAELEEIRDYNSTLANLKANHTLATKDLVVVGNDIDAARVEISRLTAEIDKLQKQLADTVAHESRLVTRREVLDVVQSKARGQVEMFEAKDEVAVMAKISGAKDLNAKVRANRELAATKEKIEASQIVSSATFQAMRRKQDDRAKIMEDAHLPVTGLTIEDGALFFPCPTNGKPVLSPDTGKPVRLSQLSEGQKIPVLTKIFASFKPGLRVMFVHNFQSIDQANREALIQAAEDAGLQLWIHETVMSGAGLRVTVM